MLCSLTHLPNICLREPVLKEIENVELNKKNMDQIPSDL